MIFLPWLILGLIVGQIQSELTTTSLALIDVRLISIALLVIPRFRNHEAVRLIAFVLGCSAMMLDPLSVMLIGSGIALFLLLRFRSLVFMEHPVFQAINTLIVAVSLQSARWLLSVTTAAPNQVPPIDWVGLGLNAALTPLCYWLLLLPLGMLRWRTRSKGRLSRKPTRIFGA